MNWTRTHVPDVNDLDGVGGHYIVDQLSTG